MSDSLNRWTTNFSGLLQQHVDLGRRERDFPFLEALEQLRERLLVVTSASSNTLGLSFCSEFLPPFMQFARAVAQPSAFIPLPTVEAAEAEDSPQPDRWLGFWVEKLDRGITHLLEKLPSNLFGLLTRLYEDNRGNVPSTPGVLQFGWLSESYLPLPTFKETVFRPSQLLSQVSRNTTVLHSFITNLGGALAPTMNLGNRVPEAFSRQSDHLVSREENLFSSQVREASLQVVTRMVNLGVCEVLPPSSVLSGRLAAGVLSGAFVRETPSLTDPLAAEFSRNILSLMDYRGLNSSLFLGISNAPTPAPEMPEGETIGATLAQIWQRSASQPLPSPERQASAEVPSGSAPINFNGGIHVQVSAQTIDPDHAEETARLIADRVRKEIERLNEQDRFRRGLPTSPYRY